VKLDAKINLYLRIYSFNKGDRYLLYDDKIFFMKTLFFLFAILLGGNFHSQERVKSSECDDIQGLRVLKSTGKPFTGIVFGNYDSGELRFEINHIDGKRIGWLKHYSKEGRILGEVNLINGNGDLKVKHENGTPALEVSYRDGLINGLVKDWYENGQLSTESNYLNGMLDGLSKDWYENGQLRTESNYLKGLLNGLSRDWYENGKLEEECNYNEGSKITCKNFNETGFLETEDIYGLQRYYNNDGKLIKEYLNGVTKEYNENTTVVDEYPIGGGEKIYNEKGILIKEVTNWYLEIEYNEKGIKISEFDLLDGSSRTWYESGQLERTTEYNNEDIRTDKYYFENGKLKKEKKSKVFISQEKEKELEILSCKCYNKKGKEVDCEK
jgi:antitoxin component YwqK of YwqJK toxin-antitoxin module